ncbi:MAG: right-handed parallel beta-helix repeat-containing protein [Oligoflexia bacterium]|nr:right-handed parallel beta-helix repeat-containing protein [Oligoflexia bacterium]
MKKAKTIFKPLSIIAIIFFITVCFSFYKLGFTSNAPKDIDLASIISQESSNYNSSINSKPFTLNGSYHINKDLIVPRNRIVELMPGTTLTFNNNTRLIIQGQIIAKGTKDKPITFRSSSDKHFWRGIHIEGNENFQSLAELVHQNFEFDDLADSSKFIPNDFFLKKDQYNIFQYCVFQNIRDKEFYEHKLNNHKAAIEVYNSLVKISNSTFKNIPFIGGIQLKFSFGLIEKNNFHSCGIHKTIHSWNSFTIIKDNSIIQESAAQDCNDGMWIIDSKTAIINNRIIGKGDDAIDFKNSIGILIDNQVEQCKDEGFDIDESSYAVLINNKAQRNYSHGLLVSNNSKVISYQNIFNNNLLNGVQVRNASSFFSYKDKITNNLLGIQCVFDLQKYIDNNRVFYDKFNWYLEYYKKNTIKSNSHKLLNKLQSSVFKAKDALQNISELLAKNPSLLTENKVLFAQMIKNNKGHIVLVQTEIANNKHGDVLQKDYSKIIISNDVESFDKIIPIKKIIELQSTYRNLEF